jgi:2,5-diketo-D-gluconate reductase A
VSSVPSLTLLDGHTIPQFGFGVFQIKPDDTEKAVAAALEVGYRHLDTAQMYGNEKEVGDAVKASGIPRDDIFITSKLNNGFHLPDDARREFGTTLTALGIERIDLFLIHWPLPGEYGGDFVQTWKTLEEFQHDGRARSIGVSNFQVHHLRRLSREATTPPAVNQIEAHPYFTNDEVRAYCIENQIAVEAWSPIAQGAVLTDPTVVEIAGRAGKTPAQVVLRWHLQRGDIVFPKSVTPERIAENFDIFDFELSDQDQAAITALDKGEPGRTGPNPDQFNYIPK